MTHHRTKPSRAQLFAAYEAGIDLNRYVQVKMRYKSHDAAMAIVAGDIKDLSLIDKLLDSGTTIDQVGNVYIQGVDLKDYLANKRVHETSVEVSHDEAIEASRLGITRDYWLLRYHKVPHFAIILFAKELPLAKRSHIRTYVEARSRGISIDDTNAMSVYPYIPSDMLPKMLDAGVTPAEIIEASTLDGPNTMVINKRSSYAYLRTNAYEGNVALTHAQAIEVINGKNITGQYIEARKQSLSHKDALAVSH